MGGKKWSIIRNSYLVHVVCAVGLIIGLLALYAPQIEQWNNKHLLSTANTNNAFEKGGDEVAEIIGKTIAEKFIRQALSLVSD